MVKLILESVSNPLAAAQVLRTMIPSVSLQDALTVVRSAPITLKNSYLPLQSHEGRGHNRFAFAPEEVERFRCRFAGCAVINEEAIPESAPELLPVLMTEREAFNWIMSAFHEIADVPECDEKKFCSAVSDAVRAVRRGATPGSADELNRRLRVGDKVRVRYYFRPKDSCTPRGLAGMQGRVVWTIGNYVETDETCPANVKFADGRIVQFKSNELDLIG